jgi:hypothetical protein
MSIRRSAAPTRARGRSWRLPLASLAVGLVAVCASTGSAAAAPAAKGECIGTGKGAAWTYKGQKGTSYTVLGVSGAPCPVGLKWLMRLTTARGMVRTGPKGWQCIVTSVVGECTIKSGGIFEWMPKLKK